MSERGAAWEVFRVALRLGLTSFGGPIAHLGYFREEYVTRRRWLDDRRFADLLALCQFLPGPASSQMGIAIGTLRAGYLGGFLAWAGFTLPSAIALTVFAIAVSTLDVSEAGWLRGLKIAAVAVVIQAVWGMARSLTPDAPRIALAAAVVGAMLLVPHALTQALAVAAGAAVGMLVLPREVTHSAGAPLARASRVHLAWLAAFAALLAFLPLLAAAGPDVVDMVDAFYRAGSLVFGGGHVVLPLLERAVVPSGWVGADEFVAGYGTAQAVPGPLFTFAAYLGAASTASPGAIPGAALALGAIFLPSFLLVWGVLPWWDRLRTFAPVQAALRGANAAVVGVLAAALYDPVWTSAIHAPGDVALAAAGVGLLLWHRTPAWLVVLLAAAAGEVLAPASGGSML